ncbi:CsbA family protein [Thermaerobacillus caldiproteolyticus]|uniref:General stress protein CsbA n=1 Tax=Thermaerobacillus caldiproteolyticus TaxID=247480 RepID=A0A7V9Z875_9BACL|nr:CsbA family protein [Anoxybacillus caldiproteolyticus]MBA2875760.1 general stress protein CsbA [Anoxybacillus caldiproteolyticus]QPA30659.1 CsbA family protein [Anoxybacillus caldiproteolyticus]
MWFIIALIVPCLLVLLFTRVTYNHYVGTLLTVALLVASYVKGYTDELHEILADIVSTTVGFLYAEKMVKRLKK